MLHAPRQVLYLTVNQPFPFRQTNPVQSVISREDLFVSKCEGFTDPLKKEKAILMQGSLKGLYLQCLPPKI